MRRQIGEIEDEPAPHARPTGRRSMAQWEDAGEGEPSREWTVVQPTVEDISTGGQRYLPQPDGSLPRRRATRRRSTR